MKMHHATVGIPKISSPEAEDAIKARLFCRYSSVNFFFKEAGFSEPTLLEFKAGFDLGKDPEKIAFAAGIQSIARNAYREAGGIVFFSVLKW